MDRYEKKLVSEFVNKNISDNFSKGNFPVTSLVTRGGNWMLNFHPYMNIRHITRTIELSAPRAGHILPPK